MESDEENNTVVGDHVGIDTHNCLIHTKDRLIATIGLDNMIIVDSGDVVLVMPNGRSQDIKALLEEIKAKGKGQYL